MMTKTLERVKVIQVSYGPYRDESGEERPGGVRIHEAWDDILQKLLVENHKFLVSCVDMDVDREAKPLPTHKVINCRQLPIATAKEWMVNDLQLGKAHAEAYKRTLDSKRIIITDGGGSREKELDKAMEIINEQNKVITSLKEDNVKRDKDMADLRKKMLAKEGK